VLVEVPVRVSANAKRALIRLARLSPEAIVGPRVHEAVGVGDQQEVPIVGVQKSLIVGQILGQLVDGEEEGGGSNPLAGVQHGVE